MCTIDKIFELSKEKGISISFICSKLGKGRGYLHDVRKGKSSLAPEFVRTIADILGVSADYLLGREKKKEAVLSDDPNEKKKDEIRRLFDQMTPEQQEALLLEGYRVVFGQDISKDDLKKPVKHGSIDNQDEDNN